MTDLESRAEHASVLHRAGSPLRRLRSGPRPGGPRLDRVLGACLVGWLLLAGFLFFVPSVDGLTHGLDPTLGHLAVFAAVGATAAALVGPAPVQVQRDVVLALVAAGVAVEIVQELATTARGFQFIDIVADTAGATAGVVGVALAYGRLPAGLVGRAMAVLSACSLLFATGMSIVGTGRIQGWWSCRSVAEAPAGAPLLRLDPDGIAVAADPTTTAALEQQLAPLRADGGYRFDGGQRAGVDQARTVTCALQDATGFELTVSLEDLPARQEGPARILALSNGVDRPNIDLQIGMVDRGVGLRVRQDGDTLHYLDVPRVAASDRVELHLRYDGSILELVADDQLVLSQAFDLDLSSWRNVALTIGNEHTGERPLTGTIRRLVLSTLP